MEVDRDIWDHPDLTGCIKLQQPAVQAVSNECSGGDHTDHNGSDKQLGNGAKDAANYGSTECSHDRDQSTQQYGSQETDGKRANQRERNGSSTGPLLGGSRRAGHEFQHLAQQCQSKENSNRIPANSRATGRRIDGESPGQSKSHDGDAPVARQRKQVGEPQQDGHQDCQRGQKVIREVHHGWIEIDRQRAPVIFPLQLLNQPRIVHLAQSDLHLQFFLRRVSQQRVVHVRKYLIPRLTPVWSTDVVARIERQA